MEWVINLFIMFPQLTGKRSNSVINLPEYPNKDLTNLCYSKQWESTLWVLMYLNANKSCLKTLSTITAINETYHNFFLNDQFVLQVNFPLPPLA